MNSNPGDTSSDSASRAAQSAACGAKFGNASLFGGSKDDFECDLCGERQADFGSVVDGDAKVNLVVRPIENLQPAL